MKRTTIEKFEKDASSLHDAIQDVINDAVNAGDACDAEILAALSVLLVKASLRAGMSLDDFLEGIELNYYVATCGETVLFDISH